MKLTSDQANYTGVIIFTCHRQEYQYYDQLETVITFSKVLSVVIVDLAQTPISFNQVVLSATQVDLTVFLAGLQLLHPEPSSLEAAAVSQI